MWALFVAAASFAAVCVPPLYEQCFAAAVQEPTSPISTPSASAGPIPDSPAGVRPFADGVRINWSELTVEVDAEVVLREGPLELFACSPRTKEHESILVVPARPMHIHQAMGLIGLTPGKPLRYDEEAKRWEEPRGDGLELRVRYTDERGTHIVPSEQWVSFAKGPDPARPIELDWVFTGSTNHPDGRFGADADGTIACLVDFESALISLRTRHSADNEQLWLTANSKEIPPRDTKCTLLISSGRPPIVEVELLKEHTARYENKSLTSEQLAGVLRGSPYDNRAARLVIYPTMYVSDDAVAVFIEEIKKSGFQGTIETKRRLSKEHIPPPG